jgi:tetratricopeptide (TPR) repeat protein
VFLAFFHKQAGEFTIEEFDTAVEHFDKNAHPKVYTYMRDLIPDEQEQDSLKAFKERLFREMGHYWCRYGNADTMKLHFVLQFQQMEENRLTTQLELKDSVVKLDGKAIVNLKNVPFAANNEEFQNLTEHIAELKKSLSACREKIKSDPENDTYINELLKISKELNEKRKELEQHEIFLFNIAKTFAQQAGKACTERMRQAQELFEQGKAAEANGILDAEDLNRDITANLHRWEQDKARVEEDRKTLLLNVNELLLKTKTAMADISLTVPQRFQQTCDAYYKAIDLQRKLDVDKADLVKTLFDYANLLHRFKHYKEVWELYEEALTIYQQLLAENESDLYKAGLAGVLHNLANLYKETNHFAKAKKEYEKALTIRGQLAEANPDYLPDLLDTLNDLAVLHDSLFVHKELEEVLKIRRQLAKTNPDAYLPDVVATLNCLGALQADEKKHEEALTLIESLAEANPDAYLAEKSYTLNCLATLLYKHQQYDEAEKDYVDALKIRRQLAEVNPDAYLPDVAQTLNDLGNFYSEISRDTKDKAVEKLKEALDIYRKLAKINPDIYLHKEAQTLKSLSKLHDADEAKQELKEVLNIYNKLPVSNNKFYKTEKLEIQKELNRRRFVMELFYIWIVTIPIILSTLILSWIFDAPALKLISFIFSVITGISTVYCFVFSVGLTIFYGYYMVGFLIYLFYGCSLYNLATSLINRYFGYQLYEIKVGWFNFLTVLVLVALIGLINFIKQKREYKKKREKTYAKAIEKYLENKSNLWE